MQQADTTLWPLWPLEKIILLRRMWAEGESAGRCAVALGITRNAVMGKVHRLGLASRRTKAENPRDGSQAPKPSVPRPPPKKKGRIEAASVIVENVAAKKRAAGPSKSELRRQFEEAWRNTVALTTAGPHFNPSENQR
jgi:hypothetical protein